MLSLHGRIDHRSLVEHATSGTVLVMPADRGGGPLRIRQEIGQSVPPAAMIDPEAARGPIITVQFLDEGLPLVVGDECAVPALVHEGVDVLAELDDLVLLGLIEMAPARAAQPVDGDAGDELSGPLALDVIRGPDVEAAVVADGAVLPSAGRDNRTSPGRPTRDGRRRNRSSTGPCRGSSPRNSRLFPWRRTSRGRAVVPALFLPRTAGSARMI